MSPGDLSAADADAAVRRAAAAVLVEHAPAVIGHVGPDGALIGVCGGLLDTLGYQSEDWVGRRLTEMIAHPDLDRLVETGLAGLPAAEVVLLEGSSWRVVVAPLHVDGAVAGALVVMTFSELVEVHHSLTATERLTEQFTALVELSNDFIALAELDGTVTFVNRAGRALVGLDTDEEALGRPTDDYFTPAGHAKSREIEDSVLAQGWWAGESELRHFGTGESIPVSVNSFLVTKDGQPLALATVQRDLRSRIRTEQALALRSHEHRAIADLAQMALTRPVPDVLDEAMRQMTARHPGLVSIVFRLVVADQTLQAVATSDETLDTFTVPLSAGTPMGRALAEGTPLVSSDLSQDERFQGFTGRRGIRGALVVPVPGSHGPWGTVGLGAREPRDWTDDDLTFVQAIATTIGAALRRTELESALAHQALHDPLTGLPNRALVRDRIEHALRRSARQGTMLAVLLLDLDDFKAVNDSLGHISGDELLSELALRFESVIREGDTVARQGGDEFVVLCEDVRSEDDVAFVAEALLEACADGVVVGEQKLALSASVGVALALSGEASTTSLLSEADIAMYRAKRDRKGSYRIFDEAMRGDALSRMNVSGELRAALRADELTVAFQPIVDLRTGRIVAMEALARWTDRDGRPVPPDVFVPIAEETGLIGEIGACVLRQAATYAASWQQHGPIGIRVNASAHELRHHGFHTQVVETLDAAGLPPELLGIEITESVLVEEDKNTEDTLNRLRDSGVTLLIDDFGTGYSSLSYLQRFPVVDVLKIDRSFLGEGTRGEAVVKAVVGLGLAFDLQVCAEGVETDEQHRRVTELGCDLAQGYHFGRPVPGPEALELVARWQDRPVP